MKKIYILTDTVHSGKTTRLMQWAAQQKNIDGIFQPVIDEKRFIYHISSKTLKQLETDDSENITKIGKYRFSNQTFDWARNILMDCMNKKLDWIIIDEIGPLELDGKALEPIVTELISSRDKISANLLCVVRSEILEEFINHYSLLSSIQLFEADDEN